jgi:hypothetical protein
METEEKRIACVGVKLTESEAETLRRVAFKQRTTESGLLRRLFVERYFRSADSKQHTE